MSDKCSPSGRYEITTRDHEAFNSHWVFTPGIADKRTGETIFDFQSTQWSLDDWEWSGDPVLKLTLRKYPGNHRPGEVFAVIDCEARTGSVGEGPPGPLTNLEARLDQALTWIHAEPEEKKPVPGLLAALQRFFRGH